MFKVQIVKAIIFTALLLVSGCAIPGQQQEVQNSLDVMQGRINTQQKVFNQTAGRIEQLKKENQALRKRIETLEKELMEITFAIYDVIQKQGPKGE